MLAGAWGLGGRALWAGTNEMAALGGEVIVSGDSLLIPFELDHEFEFRGNGDMRGRLFPLGSESPTVGIGYVKAFQREGKEGRALVVEFSSAVVVGKVYTPRFVVGLLDLDGQLIRRIEKEGVESRPKYYNALFYSHRKTEVDFGVIDISRVAHIAIKAW
jgi:hypothetical protein